MIEWIEWINQSIGNRTSFFHSQPFYQTIGFAFRPIEIKIDWWLIDWFWFFHSLITPGAEEWTSSMFSIGYRLVWVESVSQSFHRTFVCVRSSAIRTSQYLHTARTFHSGYTTFQVCRVFNSPDGRSRRVIDLVLASLTARLIKYATYWVTHVNSAAMHSCSGNNNSQHSTRVLSNSLGSNYLIEK